MTKLTLLARRLVLLWGFAAGCDGGGDGGGTTAAPGYPGGPVAPADTAALVSQLETDMHRLNALAILDVRTLVVTAGEQSSCYSLHPCAPSAADPAVAAEYARQAPRLRALVALAETTAATASAPPVEIDTPADLAALNALAIVEVSRLVKAQPSSEPLCYGLPCPEDVAAAAADRENRRRAAAAHVLATEATRSGL